MKRIIAILAMLPVLALGAANDVLMNQRNSTDTGTLSRIVTVPASGQSGILGFNGATVLPQFFSIGSGLSLSGGMLSVPAPDWANVTGKPIFATVATSGSYADLLGRPVIPAAQVNADWAASSGLAAILNKPALFSGAYADLTGIPATFPPSPHSQAWSTITSTPTTLTGYGITDAVTSASLSATLTNYATTGALATGLAGKYNSPSGTTAQYIRGDGSLATLPSPGAGTVTSITAGQGLSGGTITGSGTISLPSTGAAGTYATVTTDAQGRITSGTPLTINDSPGRSLVTASSSTGFQISTTRAAQVFYEGSFSTTSTIGGPSSVTVFLETSDTNSVNPADWTIRAQQTYTNTITLAVVLNQLQGNNWSISRFIPAGKFVRIRSGAITGTASATLNTAQQEILQ